MQTKKKQLRVLKLSPNLPPNDCYVGVGGAGRNKSHSQKKISPLVHAGAGLYGGAW